MWTTFLRRGDQASTHDEQVLEEANLESYALFDGLTTAVLRKFIPALRVKEFRDEDIVCHCDDASHDALLLLDGTVAVTRKQGHDLHVIQLDRSGAVSNVGPLVGLERQNAGLRALGSVRILALDNAMLLRFFERDPEVAYRFIRNISRLALKQCERQGEPCTDQAPG